MSSNLRLDDDYPGVIGPVAPNVHHDQRQSWVSPDVKKTPLLFISDVDTDDVYVFTTPGLKLKGTLTGFSQPSGLCSDRSGNIWVTNTKIGQITKYSRTGKLLKTLDDSGYYPVGCAVNQKNGDLAVGNIRNTNGAAGNVTIYSNGPNPVRLNNPVQSEYYFPAYDKKGNLYVNGRGGDSNGVMISECRAASSSCSTLNVSGATFNVPGGLNWNRVAGHLVVDDPDCGGDWSACLYSISVSGSTGTVKGTTQIYDATGGACEASQPALAPSGKYVAGGCIAKGSGSSLAASWKFPAGGKPTASNTSVQYPVGAAISNK